MEVILQCEKASNYKNKTKEYDFHSGGFTVIRLFEDIKKTKFLMELYKGSPRDLGSIDIKDLEAIPGSMLEINFRPYPKFDVFKEFIPENNIVTPNDIIPGLKQGNNFKFPLPSISGSKTEEEKVGLQKRTEVHLHNIAIIGNLKLDDEIKAIYAHLATEKSLTTEGRKRDKDSLNVQIRERRVNIKCHNGWKQISETKTVKLSAANREGKMETDQLVSIKDFIPNEYVAIIFEFEYVVSVQGHSEKVICLGYNTLFPELNTAGMTKNYDTDIRLNKGPGETLFNELLVSEIASESYDQIFDFVL